MTFRCATCGDDHDGLPDLEMEPTFSWLVNHLPHYDETTYLLKTRVHFRAAGKRPTIELEPTDHPLAVEQRSGITIERAWEVVHRYMPS
jgi:hypothetical protein